jgi:hypothetical protein
VRVLFVGVWVVVVGGVVGLVVVVVVVKLSMWNLVKFSSSKI